MFLCNDHYQYSNQVCMSEAIENYQVNNQFDFFHFFPQALRDAIQ